MAFKPDHPFLKAVLQAVNFSKVGPLSYLHVLDQDVFLYKLPNPPIVVARHV